LVCVSLWRTILVPVLLVGWLVALVRGELPAPLHRFISAYVRYQAHLTAFLFLIANPFPGFVGAPGYPVDLELPAAPGPQYRGRTAARLLLAVPALVVAAALLVLPALVAAILGWFASLVTGRMPRGLRDVGAWAIRYMGQAEGYLFLVTDRY